MSNTQRLVWNHGTDATADGRFKLQREHGLNEPVCWYLLTDLMSRRDRDVYEASTIDAIAFGRGAKNTVMAHVQALADLVDAPR